MNGDVTQYEIEPEDLLRVWEACAIRDPSFRSAQRFAYSVLVVSLLVALAFAIVRPPVETSTAIALLTALATLGCYPFIQRFEYRRQLRRTLRTGDWSTALGHHTLMLTTDGVREQNHAGETFHRWEAVKAVFSTDEYVFMLLGPSTGYVLPKRCLSSADDANTFERRATELWRARRS
jgi:YcxB-like protein